MRNYKITKFVEGAKGRLGAIKSISENCGSNPETIWFHSASYGEYRQCESVIAAINRERPYFRIVLTFFSPSGYKNFDNNPAIRECYYLPTATRSNARKFLDLVKPKLAILMVGDYWPAYLWELKKRGIPVIAISARLKESSGLFRWYGLAVKRAITQCLTMVLAQNDKTQNLLQSIGYSNVRVCGDPRLDALFAMKAIPWKDSVIENWSKGEKVFVAGSICPEGDFEVISELANKHPERKFLIAPHETDDSTISTFTSLLKVPFQLYSEAVNNGADSSVSVLVLNCVGILSRVYKYGYAAYIGAAFHTDEPHSVIEPAVHGIPVIFGPRYFNNPHCVGLINADAALSIKDKNELLEQYLHLEANAVSMGERALSYCESMRGATSAIVPILLEALQ